jgi:hypothetical protein
VLGKKVACLLKFWIDLSNEGKISVGKKSIRLEDLEKVHSDVKVFSGENSSPIVRMAKYTILDLCDTRPESLDEEVSEEREHAAAQTNPDKILYQRVILGRPRPDDKLSKVEIDEYVRAIEKVSGEDGAPRIVVIKPEEGHNITAFRFICDGKECLARLDDDGKFRDATSGEVIRSINLRFPIIRDKNRNYAVPIDTEDGVRFFKISEKKYERMKSPGLGLEKFPLRYTKGNHSEENLDCENIGTSANKKPHIKQRHRPQARLC